MIKNLILLRLTTLCKFCLFAKIKHRCWKKNNSRRQRLASPQQLNPTRRTEADGNIGPDFDHALKYGLVNTAIGIPPLLLTSFLEI